jgi:hypothetical protein
VSRLFRSFLKQWTIVQTDVEVAFTSGHLAGMLPLFLRHTQLQMSLYFSAATLEGGAAPPPRLMGLIEVVRERNWRILPELPLRYLVQQGPAPSSVSRPAVRESPAAGRGGAPPAAATTSGASRSPATGAGASPSGDAARQTLTPNSNPDPGLMGRFAALGRNLRDLTTAGGLVVPKTDDNRSELCLAYVLRGTCYSACRRASAHRALTATEVARVGEFLTQGGAS